MRAVFYGVVLFVGGLAIVAMAEAAHSIALAGWLSAMLEAYQHILHPIAKHLFSLTDINLPDWWHDALIAYSALGIALYPNARRMDARSPIQSTHTSTMLLLADRGTHLIFAMYWPLFFLVAPFLAGGFGNLAKICASTISVATNLMLIAFIIFAMGGGHSPTFF